MEFYLFRLITSFMRVLQRMVREHLAPTNPENSAAASELLILSLDLVKNRLVVLSLIVKWTFQKSNMCLQTDPSDFEFDPWFSYVNSLWSL